MDKKSMTKRQTAKKKYEKDLSNFNKELEKEMEKIAEKCGMPQCAICLCHIYNKSKITTCGHIFHTECFKQIDGDKCPLCRAKCKPGHTDEEHHRDSYTYEGYYYTYSFTW